MDLRLRRRAPLSPESALRRRGAAIFHDQLGGIRRHTDGVFIILMPAQWIFAIILSLWSSPHVHLLAAFAVGGAITSLPVYLTLKHPGEQMTRHIVAVGQMLMSALLVYLTGGRIATYFHVFGSLAILAFYRDRSVLLTALVIVITDHAVRGILAQGSAYSAGHAQSLLFLEHTGWLFFETIPLLYLIRQSRGEMKENANRQAELEEINQAIEAKVLERTHQLQEANARAAADREAAKEMELLKDRQKLHNQFLANVSHDLRTPITSIKGYAETLRQGGLDDMKHRLSFVRTIEKNAERLGVLVENLLDLTMIDGLKVEPHPSEISLAECLTDLALDFGPQARRKKVRILLDLPEALNVRADAGHLWQVLQNLISNAVKFSPFNGTITIRAHSEGRRIMIMVADEGPGIPSTDLELIFKRFHSQARGNKPREGTGLGLAIAKTLAELNGGTLTAHSTGQGALFSFSLPVTTDAIQ